MARASAWVVMVGLLASLQPLAAQEAGRRDSTQADSLRQDSTGATVDSLGRPIAIDTSAAARLGLPTAPSRNFPSADSVLQELLQREGYRATRYASDTVRFLAPTREIFLDGSSLVEREGTTLEAQHVEFLQEACSMVASGDPTLFESGTVMVGDTMSYDTCERQGVVQDALTNFNQSGVEWFMRGGLGIDSGATRLYTAEGQITSCDLEEPHFHFSADKMKWVNNHIMVARPARLYIRDVPIMWFPFIFQDMSPGRRSGLLTPRFGINDIVRPNEGYRRHITNVGFYFVLNDYTDLQASVDWFAGTSVSVNGELRYRWLNRFVSGALSVSRIFEAGQDGQRGRRSLRLIWNHQQSFDDRTRLTASVNFASSSSVIRDNSVDPFIQTADLQSRINFSKQLDWGTVTLGASRSQSLSDEVVTENLPVFGITPTPISLGSDATWSPTFQLNSTRRANQPIGTIELPPVNGELQDPDTLFAENRTTTINFGTPIRVGRWNWQNNFTVTDVFAEQRRVEQFPDPEDSTQSLSRVYSEDFSTEIDWNTGINLPMVFPSTWKLQPNLGIRNATSGPFLIRNRFTGGEFVQQGKRLSLGASMSPTLFGFLPGLGPIARIRHAVSPQIGWNYAPAAKVNEAYLRARNPTATTLQARSNPLHTLRLGLSQTFEGKYAVPEADSADADPAEARKVKVLNWQTSSLEYDFEQAQEPDRNGWRTQTITNSFTSDLIRGLSLRVTHDLWDGPVGFDTTAFDPFLRTMSARFSISGATITSLLSALLGGKPLEVPEEPAEADTLPTDDPVFEQRPGPMTSFRSVENLSPSPRRGQGFTASFTYEDQRVRQQDEVEDAFRRNTANRTLGMTMQFSPTENWSLSWTTLYNFTDGEFGQHLLRFDRDMHRWRATFGFTRAPNGNFAFTFFVNLLDQPEIKFNYDQQTVNR